jgi:sugar diacid utilization regulator
MAMTGRSSGSASLVGEPLSAHRHLLALSMQLTQQDDQARILVLVADAVESLGPCRAEGVFLDGAWQVARFRGQAPDCTDLAAALSSAEGGQIRQADVAWTWAYPMPVPHAPSGCLVVSAAAEPTESERFLLQVLAQQAGIALVNARLHSRERTHAAELRAANLALRRSMDIHDRLTHVALTGEGQDGIARAVYELTEHPTYIEDCFGNLRAWAGPDGPDAHQKDSPDRRERLLRRVMDASGPVRDGDRLVSVARLAGAPVGVLVLADPDRTAGEAERVAIEHATTVLAMQVAHLQNLVESKARARSNLVLELVAGDDGPGMANRAQGLGYDLGRPHRVLALECRSSNGDVDSFFHAVSRAASNAQVGSLIASRFNDVIVLADREAEWQRFHTSVVAEMHGAPCSVGVGGRCDEISDFPRSYREAQLALEMQEAIGGNGQITIFDELGIYQVLGTTTDISAIERFAKTWLGALLNYDAIHGTQLLATLGEYLDCGGNYDATATALSVHRSTLKYRLRRIREVSGHDLGVPDTQFNLHLATRAWRTIQVLRRS